MHPMLRDAQLTLFTAGATSKLVAENRAFLTFVEITSSTDFFFYDESQQIFESWLFGNIYFSVSSPLSNAWNWFYMGANGVVFWF